MRLDRFLKVSRLVKRRTVAKEVCEQGRIEVNGRPGKPGTDVKPGDRLVLRMGRKKLEVEVQDLKEQASAREAGSLYRTIGEEWDPADSDW